MNILQDLENRGLVNQVTDRDGLKKHLENNRGDLILRF